MPMTRRSLALAAALLAVLPAAGQAQACPADAGPARPFGPPATAADSGRMFSYLLSPDGRELYFFRKMDPAEEDYRIFRSRRTVAGWSAPERVPLGGEYSDLYPALSPDGNRLVFSSYRPAPSATPDTSIHSNAHLWMARRSGSGWTTPEYLAASIPGHYHSGLRQDSAGTLHLRITTPDWREQWAATLRWTGADYAPALERSPEAAAVRYWRERSGDSIYVWGDVTGPGGLTLLQVSPVQGRRRGPARYFVTRPTDAGWSAPVPAGGGPGHGAPNFAWFSADGCLLHYTRDYSEFMRVAVGALGATAR